jgi:hypothetical protein
VIHLAKLILCLIIQANESLAFTAHDECIRLSKLLKIKVCKLQADYSIFKRGLLSRVIYSYQFATMSNHPDFD